MEPIIFIQHNYNSAFVGIVSFISVLQLILWSDLNLEQTTEVAQQTFFTCIPPCCVEFESFTWTCKTTGSAKLEFREIVLQFDETTAVKSKQKYFNHHQIWEERREECLSSSSSYSSLAKMSQVILMCLLLKATHERYSYFHLAGNPIDIQPYHRYFRYLKKGVYDECSFRKVYPEVLRKSSLHQLASQNTYQLK